MLGGKFNSAGCWENSIDRDSFRPCFLRFLSWRLNAVYVQSVRLPNSINQTRMERTRGQIYVLTEGQL